LYFALVRTFFLLFDLLQSWDHRKTPSHYSSWIVTGQHEKATGQNLSAMVNYSPGAPIQRRSIIYSQTN
ncbi:hypothetical protein ACFLVF_02440, partial [Chloroflexota bacterium]